MAKIFTPRNRLADAVSDVGIGRIEASAEAHANLEHLRADSMAELDRTLEQLAELAASITGVHDDRVADVYAGANRVVAIAGVFAMHEMSGCAYELCEALSRMLDTGEWKPDAVANFVEALKAARAE